MKKTDGNSKSRKGVGGRPPRAAGERLEQFSVRLRPRTKFGLELLALDARQSLSVVIENIVERALAAAWVGNHTTLADVVGRYPANMTTREKLLDLYQTHPHLLTADDRAVAQLFWDSREVQDRDGELRDQEREEDLGEFKRYRDLMAWADANWDELVELVKDVRAAGVSRPALELGRYVGDESVQLSREKRALEYRLADLPLPIGAGSLPSDGG